MSEPHPFWTGVVSGIASFVIGFPATLLILKCIEWNGWYQMFDLPTPTLTQMIGVALFVAIVR